MFSRKSKNNVEEDRMNHEGSLNNKLAGKMIEEDGRRELSLDDFRGFDTEGWSGLDFLICVSSVALDRLEKQKKRRMKQVGTSNLMGEPGNAEKVMRQTDIKPTGDCLAPKKRFRVAFGEDVPKDVARAGFDLRFGPDGDIPLDVKERIDGMGGENIQLVCEKALTESDVKKDQHRFMMPRSTIRSPSFLRGDEREVLKSRVGVHVNELRVQLIEPTLETCEVSLRSWMMAKGERKPPTVMYGLAGGWNGVVSRNHLNKGDLVQLWSFRVDSGLRLALVAAHNV